jgi:hypothetical protein
MNLGVGGGQRRVHLRGGLGVGQGLVAQVAPQDLAQDADAIGRRQRLGCTEPQRAAAEAAR